MGITRAVVNVNMFAVRSDDPILKDLNTCFKN